MQPSGSPLTPEDERAIALARDRKRPILKAARMAHFNGSVLAIFGVLTAVFGLTSPSSLALAAALGLLARNEFRGRDQLRALDASGARLLGKNQIALWVLIVVSSLWSLRVALSDPSLDLSAYTGGLGADEDLGALARKLLVWVYVLVILVSLVYQGLTARFYFAREPMIRAYLAQTPEWVVALESRM